MATVTLEFEWHTGQAANLTADIVEADDSAITNGSGLSATELTNGKRRYRVSFDNTGGVTGHVTLHPILGGQYMEPVFHYNMVDTTPVQYAKASPDSAANPVALEGADGDTLETISDQIDTVVGGVGTNITTETTLVTVE